MIPSRELDELVAQKMGLETGSIGYRKVIMQRGYGCGTHECQKLHSRTMPEYSTDISAAWEVVEILRSKGFSVDVCSYPEERLWLKPPYDKAPADEWILTKCEFYYQCRISRFEIEYGGWVGAADPTAKTAAHAICLAALEVLK